MSTILKFMADDHDRLDRIFGDFKKIKNSDKAKAKELFRLFKTGLQRHIVWEEEILFPIFEEKTGMRNAGPTAVMRNEHQEIKKFLETIHGGVANAKIDTNDAESGLVAVLTDHNNKEENILYPWIDKSLTAKEREDLFKKMEELPAAKFNHCCGAH